MKAFPLRAALVASVVLIHTLSPAGRAEMREFKDPYGRVIKAELVSHPGGGETVKIRREGGKVMTVKVSIFSKEDQEFIQNWMTANPPTADFSFRFKVDKKRLSSQKSRRGSYKKVSVDEMAYEVELTSQSREQLPPFSIKYRMYVTDRADGGYGSSELGAKKVVEGMVDVRKTLKYNGNIKFTTKPVVIEKVTYDSRYSSSTRYHDQLDGLIMRLYDQAGKHVAEFRTAEKSNEKRVWKEAGGTESIILE